MMLHFILVIIFILAFCLVGDFLKNADGRVRAKQNELDLNKILGGGKNENN